MADIEINCSTCIYAHYHSQDYPCCECNPHTLGCWAGLKMFGVEFGADGPREVRRKDEHDRRRD